MKYFQKTQNTSVKNTSQPFGLMCVKNVMAEKKPNNKKVLKLYKSYAKQQRTKAW